MKRRLFVKMLAIVPAVLAGLPFVKAAAVPMTATEALTLQESFVQQYAREFQAAFARKQSSLMRELMLRQAEKIVNPPFLNGPPT